MPIRQRAVARWTELFAILGAAVTLLTAAPAQAAVDGIAPPPSARTSLSNAATSDIADASAASNSIDLCTDPYFHLGGVFYCGGPYSSNGESWYAFPNGALQLFVIGTDHAVWTRWSNSSRTAWSSWTSLGGSCRSAVYIRSNRYNPIIYVLGSDGSWWHRARANNGVWTPWRV